jgi:hypothetical protein
MKKSRTQQPQTCANDLSRPRYRDTLCVVNPNQNHTPQKTTRKATRKTTRKTTRKDSKTGQQTGQRDETTHATVRRDNEAARQDNQAARQDNEIRQIDKNTHSETRQRGSSHSSRLRQKTARRSRTRQRDKTARRRDKMARKHDGAMQQDSGILIAGVPQRVAVSSGSRVDVPEQGNDKRQQDKTRLARSRTRWRGRARCRRTPWRGARARDTQRLLEESCANNNPSECAQCNARFW